MCPHRLLLWAEGAAPTPTPDRHRLCIRCGHCSAVCPAGLSLCEAQETADRLLLPADPPDARTVLDLFRRRRSVRCYEERPLGDEVVGRLMEGARYAPTGHNSLQVECAAVLSTAAVTRLREGILTFYRRIFRAVRNPFGRTALRLVVGRERVQELLSSLPGAERAERRLAEGEDPLFHGAPAVLLLHAPRQGETSESDCALAAGQLTLLAPSLGLGTCHIGFASAALKRLPGLAQRFGVPRDRKTYAVLTVGYPSARFLRSVSRPPTRVTVTR